MSGTWSVIIIILVVIQVAGSLWLLQALTSNPQDEGEGDTTGHTWDEDLKEWNNPLPRWWLYLFWLTAIWLVVYLVLYPGFGSFSGVAGWTQEAQYEQEVARAEERYGDIYGAFAALSLEEMARDPDAVKLGRNLFLNNCATCHGSDARGAIGFPNLTDNAWLSDSSPAGIQNTIANGRIGVMPALGAALGEAGADAVVAYVRSLGGEQRDASLVEAGKQQYMLYCVACHAQDGTGMQALGAPNLTDNIWLHGSSDAAIRDVIVNGRTNQMPAQKEILTDDRIRTVVAYVMSLNEGS
jgi:cytochrome c oxidase cbb3-type subunit 3